MLSVFLRWLSGDVAQSLAKAYADRNNAQTDQQRIAANARIRALEIQQEARAQGGRLTAWMQAAWAAPFVIYDAKLLLWDKVLGIGATDPLSPTLAASHDLMLGFYFGGAAAIGVARALRR